MSDGLVLVGKVEEEYGGGRRSDVHDNGGRACTLARTGNRVALDGSGGSDTHIKTRIHYLPVVHSSDTMPSSRERGRGGIGFRVGFEGIPACNILAHEEVHAKMSSESPPARSVAWNHTIRLDVLG